MFAMPPAGKFTQVEIGDGGNNIAVIGEGGGKIEQEPVAREDGIDVLPLGILLVALVRLVQQDIPLAVVVIAAKVNDLFLALVTQVVGTVGEDRDFLAAEQGGGFPAGISIIAQFAQADEQTASLVELVHMAAQLLNQVIPVGKHQDGMAGDIAALREQPQQFHHLDDHQRLAGGGRHPEGHAVDELPVGQAVIFIHLVISAQQACQLAPGSRGTVHGQVQVAFQPGIAVPLHERLLPGRDVDAGRAVIFPQCLQRLAQGCLLVFIQPFARRKGSQVKPGPVGGQAALLQGIHHGFQEDSRHLTATR